MSKNNDADKIRRATEAFKEQQRELGQKALEAELARQEQIKQQAERLSRARDAAMTRLEAGDYRNPAPGMVYVHEDTEHRLLLKHWTSTRTTQIPGWEVYSGRGRYPAPGHDMGTFEVAVSLLIDGSFYAAQLHYAFYENHPSYSYLKLEPLELVECIEDLSQLERNLNVLGTPQSES